MKQLILLQAAIFAIFIIGVLLTVDNSDQYEVVEFKPVAGAAHVDPSYNSATAQLRVLTGDERSNTVPTILVVEEPSVVEETVPNEITGNALLDPRSQVLFWFSTPNGAVKDLLKDGESKVYNFGRIEYKVDVVFIGQGDDGLGEVLFLVNGMSTKALSRKESKVFSKNEFIYVREVFYKR